MILKYKLRKWFNNSLVRKSIFTLFIGSLILTIFFSLILTTSVSSSKVKTSTNDENDILQPQISLDKVNAANTWSSEFNYLYSRYLNSTISEAIEAKKNLFISDEGNRKELNTTYEGLKWNYTDINEDTKAIFNLWKNRKMFIAYDWLNQQNTFGYVTNSSFQGGYQCYYEIAKTPYNECVKYRIGSDITYHSVTSKTLYPENWTMNDIMNKNLVFDYIMDHSIYNTIFDKSHETYPLAFKWGDDEIYSKKNKSITSGNHLTFYFKDKLENIHLSFKAQFYGHLLIKEDYDKPFQKIKSSNGDLLQFDTDINSMVALRIITSPDLDRKRGILYQQISSNPNNYLERRENIQDAFERLDKYNKLFLYYINLKDNAGNDLVAKKLNATAIGINRLLTDEKDINFAIHSKFLERVKNIYFEILKQIGFGEYNLNFVLDKNKDDYEKHAFKLFSEGQLDSSLRYIVENLPIGYQVTNSVIDSNTTSSNIPLKKPFGWKKNSINLVIKVKKKQNYVDNQLLVSKDFYGDIDYDVYRNPPSFNIKVISQAINNSLINRFLLSNQLQLESHFVSTFYDTYDSDIANDETLLVNYKKLAKMLSFIAQQTLTVNYNFLSNHNNEELFYDSYYLNDKKKLINNTSNEETLVKIIQYFFGNNITTSDILKKIEETNQNGTPYSYRQGFRAFKEDDQQPFTPQQFIDKTLDLINEVDFSTLFKLFNRIFNYSTNENLLQYIVLSLLTFNRSVSRDNIALNTILTGSRRIYEFSKFLGVPTETVTIKNQYVKSPFIKDRNKEVWEIGKIFDVKEGDTRFTQEISNFINAQFEDYGVTWSGEGQTYSQFIPLIYQNNSELDNEVKKAYLYQARKDYSEYRVLTITLLGQDPILRFINELVKKMVRNNYIGGARQSFNYFNSAPSYRINEVNDVIQISECNTSDLGIMLAPSDGSWCGIKTNRRDYDFQDFSLLKGEKYMSFVNTNDFFHILGVALNQNYLQGDPTITLKHFINLLISYLYYLTI